MCVYVCVCSHAAIRVFVPCVSSSRRTYRVVVSMTWPQGGCQATDSPTWCSHCCRYVKGRGYAVCTLHLQTHIKVHGTSIAAGAGNTRACLANLLHARPRRQCAWLCCLCLRARCTSHRAHTTHGGTHTHTHRHPGRAVHTTHTATYKHTCMYMVLALLQVQCSYYHASLYTLCASPCCPLWPIRVYGA